MSSEGLCLLKLLYQLDSTRSTVSGQSDVLLSLLFHYAAMLSVFKFNCCNKARTLTRIDCIILSLVSAVVAILASFSMGAEPSLPEKYFDST